VKLEKAIDTTRDGKVSAQEVNLYQEGRYEMNGVPINHE